ncbi:MAG TPA: lysophospholipid acyltransferase family protein [Steroidobacteraceae bacterium]|nr:lysophospholipid acyltransferase family protein [Steroidobacteraceae bacterium]
MRPVLRAGYGLWCWAVFIPLAAGVLVLGLPVPSITLRRRMARLAARAFFGCTGIRFAVTGLDRLPPGASVVVANHASYLDGVILQAALPARFAFVVKREMVRMPFASLLLHRLGCEFVERFDHHKGSVDARRVLRVAAAGQALAFFPEGTFSEQVGLARFHAGAFVAAARAGLPLVPAVIRGARQVLPPAAALPRRGAIEVEILGPIPAAGPNERESAARLRTAARAAMLSHLTDPDLEA